jgi:hypothetical protein
MDTVSVKEAAKTLGITEQSVRKRISVGTLSSYKDDDNRVHVYLPDTTTSTTTSDDYSTTYIASLEEQISYLKDQLEESHEANRQLRQIVAIQAQRLPEIESSPTDTMAEPQKLSEDVQHPRWWQRLFGREN